MRRLSRCRPARAGPVGGPVSQPATFEFRDQVCWKLVGVLSLENAESWLTGCWFSASTILGTKSGLVLSTSQDAAVRVHASIRPAGRTNEEKPGFRAYCRRQFADPAPGPCARSR